ncbi:MAG TPA: ferritin-like domain-containing protein [Acidimicrobiales bacterium]|nr:ferritin-like domain-containing protein [Acidimicrobiales bacterium]
MTKRDKEVLAGTESDLNSMTRNLDELHHDVGMPALRDGVDAMVEDMQRTARSTSRRTFLLGAGAAATGGAMLAIGGAPALAGASTRRLAPMRDEAAAVFPPSDLKGDLAVAAVAASLENLAVYAYSAGLTAATAGKLGTVPPAVATFATTVKGQHQQHADAWNGVLKSHGKAAVTVTNPKLTPTVQSDFAKVTDVTGLAQLALTLETIAAQTYQAETTMLKATSAIGLSSSIQPVEMQHIAILYYVLGMYPGSQTSSGTPLAFNPTSMAV